MNCFYLRKIFFPLVLALLLSGCLKSENPIYSKSDSVTPLVGEFGFYNGLNGAGTSIHLASSADGYYKTQSDSGFTSGIVVPLRGHSNYYIFQTKTPRKPYNYVLLKYSKGGIFSNMELLYFPVRVFQIFNSNKSLSIKERKGSKGGWFVKDKATLEAAYSIAIKKGYLTKASKYQIFDISNSGKRAAFAQLLSDANKLNKFSFTGKDVSKNPTKGREFPRNTDIRGAMQKLAAGRGLSILSFKLNKCYRKKNSKKYLCQLKATYKGNSQLTALAAKFANIGGPLWADFRKGSNGWYHVQSYLSCTIRNNSSNCKLKK